MAYFNNYCAGTYTVEVFDENNCVAQDLIIINEPLSLMFKLQHLIGIIIKLDVMERIQDMQTLQFPVEYRHILKLY